MKKGLKVVSLFDGISCGRVALERIGLPVAEYLASEIDKYSISITQRNFPNTIQLGDVNNIDFEQIKNGGIDMLIGGSPCQDLSISGKRAGLQGERSSLFYQFVKAKKILKPKYFLLENNYGMPPEAYEEMSELLGCYPILIDSALVSAQSRKRYYWTNIGPANYNLFGFPTCAIPQPKNKNIFLKDVLLSGYGVVAKTYAHQINRATNKALSLLARDYKGFGNQATNGVLEPIKLGYLGEKQHQSTNVYSVKGKSVTLCANGGGQGAKTGLYKIDLPDGDYIIRKLDPIECERLQTLPDNYTHGVSNTQRYKMLGNCWTVDVIAHIFSFMKFESEVVA